MGVINWYLDWCDRWLPGYNRPEENPDDAPCERCQEIIDPTVTACPECGNCPYKTAKWNGVIMMAAGLFLSLTAIGAILGVPLFLMGLIVRLGAGKLSPTEHDFGSSA